MKLHRLVISFRQFSEIIGELTGLICTDDDHEDGIASYGSAAQVIRLFPELMTYINCSTDDDVSAVALIFASKEQKAKFILKYSPFEVLED